MEESGNVSKEETKGQSSPDTTSKRQQPIFQIIPKKKTGGVVMLSSKKKRNKALVQARSNDTNMLKEEPSIDQLNEAVRMQHEESKQLDGSLNKVNENSHDDDLAKANQQKSMTISQSRDDLSNSQSQMASVSQKVSKKKLPALKFKDQTAAVAQQVLSQAQGSSTSRREKRKLRNYTTKSAAIGDPSQQVNMNIATGQSKTTQVQARRHSRTGSRGTQNANGPEIAITEQPESGVIKKSASKKGLPRPPMSKRKDKIKKSDQPKIESEEFDDQESASGFSPTNKREAEASCEEEQIKMPPTIQVEKLSSEIQQMNALGSTVELAIDLKETEISIDNDDVQIKPMQKRNYFSPKNDREDQREPEHVPAMTLVECLGETTTSMGHGSSMVDASATGKTDVSALRATEEIARTSPSALPAVGVNYPPPEEIYYRERPAATRSDVVYSGLNIVFKKCHEFSEDPNQAGGELNPNQPTTNLPWGVNGCPASKQEPLISYVRNNLPQVVYCRYGVDYLKSFRADEDNIAMGSYRINLDHLIVQKQKNIETEDGGGLLGLNFLKTKGQLAQHAQKQPQAQAAGGGSTMIIPFYKQPASKENGGPEPFLQFDSVFESGNLAVAVQENTNEYNLILQNDINTNGHTQWFYFKVKSTFSKRTSVKLNLVNLYKHKSLYQAGLRVLVLDVTSSAQNGEGDGALPKWERCGRDITYQQNRFTNDQCPNGLFQLSFTYDFEAGEREQYFAHSMPYTYTMLCKYLNTHVTKEKAKRQTLCYSLAGNKVEYLYITGKRKEIAPQSTTASTAKDNILTGEYRTGSMHSHVPADEEEKKTRNKNIEVSTPHAPATSPTKAGGSPLKRQRSLGKKDKRKSTTQNVTQPKQFEKQVVILTSRVHPGETNASWMMLGLLELLLNPKPGTEEEELVTRLKDHFEFYIIPMLNVDGVITGNYRCSLAACDLNRKWLKPSKILHPPVYATKKLCTQLQEHERKSFFLYLDFHGHSAKKNIFNYGNNRLDGGVPFPRTGKVTHTPATFPLVLSKQKGFDYFNFNDCTFSMPKIKESTARIAMFQKLRIPFVFTLEASFAGASKGYLAGQHFSQKDLMNVGKYVLQTIWEVKKLEFDKNLLKMLVDEAQRITVKEDGEGAGDDSDGCSSSDDDAPIPAAPASNAASKKNLPAANTAEPGEDTRQGTPSGSPKKPAEPAATASATTSPLISPTAGAAGPSAANTRGKLTLQTPALSPTEKDSKTAEPKSQKNGIIVGNKRKIIHLRQVEAQDTPPKEGTASHSAQYFQRVSGTADSAQVTGKRRWTVRGSEAIGHQAHQRYNPTALHSQVPWRTGGLEMTDNVAPFARGNVHEYASEQKRGSQRAHVGGTNAQHFHFGGSQGGIGGPLSSSSVLTGGSIGLSSAQRHVPGGSGYASSVQPWEAEQQRTRGGRPDVKGHTSNVRSERHAPSSYQTHSQSNSQNMQQSQGYSSGSQNQQAYSTNPPTSTGDYGGRLDEKSQMTEEGLVSRQQEIFEQFHQEIERTFQQQQVTLDEIFKQAAKNFTAGTQSSAIGETRDQVAQFLLSQGGHQDWNASPAAGSRGARLQDQLRAGGHQRRTGTAGDYFNAGGFRSDGYAKQRNDQQSEALMQLQRLYQMQKLNQLAQMQFFKQQAELLLNQNLSQQQQLELFQQFSFYQAQIQMQNQQYQIMLSQSLHGSYMTKLGKRGGAPGDASANSRPKLKSTAQSRQSEYPGSAGQYASAQPRSSKHYDLTKQPHLQASQTPISPKGFQQRDESARGYHRTAGPKQLTSSESCAPVSANDSLRPKSRVSHADRHGGAGTAGQARGEHGTGARSSVVSDNMKAGDEDQTNVSPRVRLSEPDLINSTMSKAPPSRLLSQQKRSPMGPTIVTRGSQHGRRVDQAAGETSALLEGAEANAADQRELFRQIFRQKKIMQTQQNFNKRVPSHQLHSRSNAQSLQTSSQGHLAAPESSFGGNSRVKTPIAEPDDADFTNDARAGLSREMLASPGMHGINHQSMRSPVKRTAPTGTAGPLSTEPTHALESASLEDVTQEIESPQMFSKTSAAYKAYNGPRGSGPSLDHMRHKKRKELAAQMQHNDVAPMSSGPWKSSAGDVRAPNMAEQLLDADNALSSAHRQVLQIKRDAVSFQTNPARPQGLSQINYQGFSQVQRRQKSKEAQSPTKNAQELNAQRNALDRPPCEDDYQQSTNVSHEDSFHVAQVVKQGKRFNQAGAMTTSDRAYQTQPKFFQSRDNRFGTRFKMMQPGPIVTGTGTATRESASKDPPQLMPPGLAALRQHEENIQYAALNRHDALQELGGYRTHVGVHGHSPQLPSSGTSPKPNSSQQALRTSQFTAEQIAAQRQRAKHTHDGGASGHMVIDMQAAHSRGADFVAGSLGEQLAADRLLGRNGQESQHAPAGSFTAGERAQGASAVDVRRKNAFM